jgi:hypothetical protein
MVKRSTLCRQGTSVCSKSLKKHCSIFCLNNLDCTQATRCLKLFFTNLLGYNWLWVSTDQPHGTLVNWAIEPNAEKLEPGSFQPFVQSSYDGNNTILINQDNRKILLKRSFSLVYKIFKGIIYYIYCVQLLYMIYKLGKDEQT